MHRRAARAHPWKGPLAALFLALPAASQAPQPAQAGPAPNRADYAIHARLEVSEMRLAGSERIRWTNGTQEEVSDLWFHLYLNAFANDRSTHLLEARDTGRQAPRGSEWGWSQPSAARLIAPGAAVDLFPSLRFRTDDEASPDDLTVFSLDLPSPVPPGGTIEIEVEWVSQLPRVRRRTGHKGDFLLVAQWFPKLGVYEQGRGWNCHPFHANTEFYSDYGSYEVTLDLPSEYLGKVGGSGTAGAVRLLGSDRLEAVFRAPDPDDTQRPDWSGRVPLVHDFTWTGDPGFVVSHDTFRWRDWASRYEGEVARVQAALGPHEDISLRDVEVTVLLQPEHADQAERHFKATCAALFFYGLWFGPYPYEHITVVDPAWGGGSAGGMEYPTLFTCGTRLFARPEEHVPESVTVHECGHQFWYGLVGNNEFEAAWMDEGFNSYTDSEVLWRVYGPSEAFTRYSAIPLRGEMLAPRPGGGPIADLLAARSIRIPLLPDPTPMRASGLLDLWREQPWFALARRTTDPRWNDRTRYLGDPASDPIDAAGWRYANRQSYSVNSYPRTAVALRSLSGLVGWDAFLRGMRHHARTWRYRHPYPEDFFRAFQEGSGVEQDLSWYFQEMFRGTGTADWSVEVRQRRRTEPKGWFLDESGAFTRKTAEEAEPPSPPSDGGDDEEAEDRDSSAAWEIELLLRRRGELCLPVSVRLEYEGGRIQELEWTREEQLARRWKKFELLGAEKLRSAAVDPDHRWWIDGDLSNDRWYDETDAVAPWRWAERVFSQYGHLLSSYMGIGG